MERYLCEIVIAEAVDRIDFRGGVGIFAGHLAGFTSVLIHAGWLVLGGEMSARTCFSIGACVESRRTYLPLFFIGARHGRSGHSVPDPRTLILKTYVEPAPMHFPCELKINFRFILLWCPVSRRRRGPAF